MLETLDYTICIGSTPTFLYLLWLAQLDRRIKHTWSDFEHQNTWNGRILNHTPLIFFSRKTWSGF